MSAVRKLAIVGRDCVGCGSCENACPRDAIHVFAGVVALVDNDKCIGCGKCAGICPAAIIELREREAQA
ncbi:MAG: ATP-binding protein [Candidatus Heteroscillospira sp.]